MYMICNITKYILLMLLFCLKGTPTWTIVQMLWSFLKLFLGGPQGYWKGRFTEGATIIMIGMVTVIRYEESSGSITLESFKQVTIAQQRGG